jgi:hypothetical protein
MLSTALRRGGLASVATAAALAMAGWSAPATAGEYITLNSATMVTTYQAHIDGFGAAYSNGVTFDTSPLGDPSTHNLIYGFCIDIFHEMPINKSLGYTYYSNKDDPGEPLTTNFDGSSLTQDQIDQVSALVDLGFLLHRDHYADDEKHDTDIQTAAIQAAIWEILNPGKVTLITSNIHNWSDKHAYVDAYDYYLNTDFAGPTERIYTITDTAQRKSHQAFAVGWPIEGGVPEPGTWALMILGFGVAGSAVRSQRRRQAAAA